MIRRLVHILAATLGLAAPAAAHPHVFIDAGLHLIFDDQGQLAAVRVVWAYDELYSLLLVEDRGLDPDGDGELTEAELQSLAGTDVDWEAGFPGDIDLQQGGEAVALARPVEHRAAFADGRLITTHIRPLTTRLDPGAAPVVAKIYDPTYFVAYDVTLELRVEGREGCSIARSPADLGRAYDLVEEALYGPDSAKYDEDNYPEVGEAFADELRLICDGSS